MTNDYIDLNKKVKYQISITLTEKSEALALIKSLIDFWNIDIEQIKKELK